MKLAGLRQPVQPRRFVRAIAAGGASLFNQVEGFDKFSEITFVQRFTADNFIDGLQFAQGKSFIHETERYCRTR